MTGPEHYREAERLLAVASESKDTTFEGHNPEADGTIAEAHVHATLALAAATALGSTRTGAMPAADYEAWRVTSGAKEAGR
ncbi:hypothetical protein [Streptomyces scabiei]|uniref:hypothetical protein n=1 Tax=Streptomyces scabiei TaxID=1930 RepID=UPI0029B97142|nr:hypothetical protein [Streptomyces scabiei]MDX3033924.1 hypothetical protein [Streptomyces scabiei]